MARHSDNPKKLVTPSGMLTGMNCVDPPNPGGDPATRSSASETKGDNPSRPLVMKDITNPRIIVLKGVLFVLAGLLAAGLLILEHPTLKTAFLLALAVWCFARAYYFAFYVIQHYVDPAFRFSGLRSFVVFMVRRKRREENWLRR